AVLAQLSLAGSSSLLCVHESRGIRVVDLSSGEEVMEWVAHSGAILGVDFSSQQQFVASGGFPFFPHPPLLPARLHKHTHALAHLADSNSSLRFWTPPDFRCTKEFELRCQGKGLLPASL